MDLTYLPSFFWRQAALLAQARLLAAGFCEILPLRTDFIDSPGRMDYREFDRTWSEARHLAGDLSGLIPSWFVSSEKRFTRRPLLNEAVFQSLAAAGGEIISEYFQVRTFGKTVPPRS
ncbi:MAG: hypothetical protein V3T83_12995, partial [Acidobacteriota bacterium]